ncbi:MAG: hypothetical protein OXR68_02480 [Alphaproteobacteria bacterium]|nr:hypothetical protein [Alphaproteobacteria bacterium]MDD9919475.1 hypothetical protein [Alphaproteobacteria bacterium]
MITKRYTTGFLPVLSLTLGLLMTSCSNYYMDEVRAPTEQELEDARAGKTLRPRTFLREGVFHMQRVQRGSTVRVRDEIRLKKPNLPPFDVAYIARDIESVLLELANTAGESIIVPQGLRGRQITLVHSGAGFQEMLNLVLSKAGYHYNYVEGIWYVTRYPIRNYILEIGQSNRKGGLIAKTELAADSATTNASGTDISTEYSDTVWAQVKATMDEFINVGKSELSGSSSGGTTAAPIEAKGLTGSGDLVASDGSTVKIQEEPAPQQTSSNDILPPPTLEGDVDEEEQIMAGLNSGDVQSFEITRPDNNNNLVAEENADTWYKLTESAGLITVRAAPEAHRLIEEYLDQVQSASHRQVVVEARIVALIRDKTTDRGFQLSGVIDKDSIFSGAFGFTPASQLDATALQGGHLNLTASPNNTKDLTAIMQSLSTLGDVYTLSSPSLLARNNQMSRVSVTRQLGYVETEVETATGANAEVSIGARTDRAKFKNAGTVMSIMPFIGKSKVQMRFRLSVATKSSETKVNTSIGDAAPVENTVPNLANNIIDQDMVLEFGRVYAIGGLIETSTTINDSYDPTLNQLPGLGEVFSRANNNKQDTEFIVLIRVSRA